MTKLAAILIVAVLAFGLVSAYAITPNTVSGVGNIFVGLSGSNTVTGDNNYINGSSNTITGYNNNIQGDSNTFTGHDSKVIGASNTLTGNYTNITGASNTITGNNIIVLGSSNTFTGQDVTVTGSNNTIVVTPNPPSTTVIPPTTPIPPVVVVVSPTLNTGHAMNCAIAYYAKNPLWCPQLIVPPTAVVIVPVVTTCPISKLTLETFEYAGFSDEVAKKLASCEYQIDASALFKHTGISFL